MGQAKLKHEQGELFNIPMGSTLLELAVFVNSQNTLSGIQKDVVNFLNKMHVVKGCGPEVCHITSNEVVLSCWYDLEKEIYVFQDQTQTIQWRIAHNELEERSSLYSNGSQLHSLVFASLLASHYPNLTFSQLLFKDVKGFKPNKELDELCFDVLMASLRGHRCSELQVTDSFGWPTGKGRRHIPYVVTDISDSGFRVGINDPQVGFNLYCDFGDHYPCLANLEKQFDHLCAVNCHSKEHDTV